MNILEIQRIESRLAIKSERKLSWVNICGSYGIGMIIYQVKPGDSIYKIAAHYKVAPERIIADNGLREPGKLSVGQSLVIIPPRKTYRVRAGDTIYDIANRNRISVGDLWRMNPELGGRTEVDPGQVLTVSLPTPLGGDLSVTGYAYENISPGVLLKTLPYLTYLAIHSYGLDNSGKLIGMDDEKLIETARSYGVAPLMMLSNINENGNFSQSAVNRLLESDGAQSNLIEEVGNVLEEKRYYGVELDFEFIEDDNAGAYADFIDKLKKVLGDVRISVQLEPKTDGQSRGILYDGHDYESVGKVVDAVMLQTYEWGYAYGEPMPPAPIEKIIQVLDFAKSNIPRGKIYVGMPTFGFDWALPYVEGKSRGAFVSDATAPELAYEKNAEIKYDRKLEAPYFGYYDKTGRGPVEHIVWFGDAESDRSRLDKIGDYALPGIGVWTVMNYSPALWSVLRSMYGIKKVLE